MPKTPSNFRDVHPSNFRNVHAFLEISFKVMTALRCPHLHPHRRRSRSRSDRRQEVIFAETHERRLLAEASLGALR